VHIVRAGELPSAGQSADSCGCGVPARAMRQTSGPAAKPRSRQNFTSCRTACSKCTTGIASSRQARRPGLPVSQSREEAIVPLRPGFSLSSWYGSVAKRRQDATKASSRVEPPRAKALLVPFTAPATYQNYRQAAAPQRLEGEIAASSCASRSRRYRPGLKPRAS